MWYQQDGATPHRTNQNLRAIRGRFGNRYNGPGAQAPAQLWPPRSPDLTPLDYFVWGLVKDLGYAEEIEDLEQLENRIRAAINSITPDMLANSRANMLRRLDCCIEQHGGHFEHLLVN